jgi:Fur family peroxide stress response transcriptional regulator
MQRFSEKREAILKNMRSRKDHPTADMVYADIRKLYPDISMGTVYRDLSDLCDEGLIIKIGAAGKERYDGDVSLHTHFFCSGCGKVFDVFSPLSLRGLSAAEKETGGRIDTVSITLRGICRECIDDKNKITKN